MSWAQGPLIGFDTETTGTDVTADRIVTAALVRREGGTTAASTWLIDPGVEIPAAASAIHGVTTELAVAEGQDPATALEEIAAGLASAVASGAPVVAFNAAFDLAILDAELRRHALATLPERLGGEVAPVLDPLIIDRAVDRYRRGKRTLSDLCRVYDVVPADGGLHSAEVDVVATLDVLAAMTLRHPELATTTPDRLHEDQRVWHRQWAEDFNVWRERQGYTGPAAETVWLGR